MKHPSQMRYRRRQLSHLRLKDPDYVLADYKYLQSRAILQDMPSAANPAVHGNWAILLLSQYPWEFNDFQCLNIS